MHAYGIKDTTGVEKGKPVFKEGDTSYDTETIRYNFKTKKAGITCLLYTSNPIVRSPIHYVINLLFVSIQK